MKVLVCIASYGTNNDIHLAKVLATYRAMPYETDIIVFSNIDRDLGDDITVLVGLPTKDPWSLPFLHKQVFADHIDQYDVYIYSEDDILLSSHNIDAFLTVSSVLPSDELVGFFRYEKDNAGRIFYPDAHRCFHWDATSARSRGAYSFGFYTNEHAACYALTNKHLKQALRSGGFLVGPHQGKYDLLVTAATDPYTQCGYQKLLCTSHFADFLVHHLPNKYIGTMSLEACFFESQIATMQELCRESSPTRPLVEPHPKFRAARFAKDYYEPIRNDLITLVPEGVQNVLSVGCGWGATEEALAKTGRSVTAIPLDAVIAACAEKRSVKVVPGDPAIALRHLSDHKFDCIIVSNILHLVDDPSAFFASLAQLLNEGAVAIVSVPNICGVSVMWRTLRREQSYRGLGDFEKSGVHPASGSLIGKWLRKGNCKVRAVRHILPARAALLNHATMGLMRPLLSSEIVAVATKET
jgi:2-polyprenyl-3-methyl-5-hydroxy-6-metoxy-1,4-benzoquinol methylase